MRFQVTQVMDAIEPRLTTDITGAQAVVDLGEVVRGKELDGSARPVNLVRIGLVVDALSRYLVDGGAMIYGVVERKLLSEGALTSKERMVLSRWADDGLIEATTAVADRAVELADLTGLPLIAMRALPEFAGRFPWLQQDPARVLRVSPRHGTAVLAPVYEQEADSAEPAVGRATPRKPEETGNDAPAEAADDVPEGAGDASEGADDASEGAAADTPVEVFGDRVAAPAARVRMSRHRFLRAEPNPAHAELLTRRWRCQESDCPAFGEYRRIGQPVPRLREGTPVCPRHGEPVTDAGPRPPAYPVSIVVDDLPRRRLVVRHDQPVTVGRTDDDPDAVSVAAWLHRAAAAWIGPTHVRLEATEEGLVVTDLSGRGTIIWRRGGPEERGTAEPLRRAAFTLGEWDSVELYTGIELVPGDRRPAGILGPVEPASVLVDAPTAAHPKVTTSKTSPTPATTSA